MIASAPDAAGREHLTVLQGFLLGLVQGLTEFLPVSSSGHLVLAQALLGIESPGVLVEIVTHAGTLLAILLAFRRRLRSLLWSLRVLPHLGSATRQDRQELRLVGLLAIGSIPAAAVGLLFKRTIESSFDSPSLALGMLCVTGVFLIATRWAPPPTRSLQLPRVLAVGIAQAVAILPGVSRSGSTIGTALLLGVDGAVAAELSFLLAIPAIGGALLLQLLESPATSATLPLLVAFLTAFVSGYAALGALFRVLARRSLWRFGIYCLGVGALGLTILAWP